MSEGGISRDTYFSKLKVVTVGDSSVGKTCILYRFLRDEFYDSYVPTIIENQMTQMKIEDHYVQFELWDTAGQEEYSELRRLSYHLTDIFLLVFSVVDMNSWENAIKLWYPDLTNNFKRPIIVFVGNKIDLRTSEAVEAGTHVSKENAENIIKKLGCKYYECSAKEKSGVVELFNLSAKICLKKKNEDLGFPNFRKPDNNIFGCCSNGSCSIF